MAVFAGIGDVQHVRTGCLHLRRTDPDGQAHFVTVSGKPAFDEHGGFSGYRGVASDVTARMRAEEQLRESERQLRQLKGE